MTDLLASAENKLAIEQAERIEKLERALDDARETIDGLTELVKVQPADIHAVLAENERLVAWQKQLQARAKTAIDEMRGGMSIRGSFCNYCKEAFTTMEGLTPDECAAAAREHDQTCAANPVTADRDRLLARQGELEKDLERWIETSANFLQAGATAEAERDRYAKVFEAAKKWRLARRGMHTNGPQQTLLERDTLVALNAAIDSALAAGKEQT